jgi:hypothetical protein
MVVRRDIDFEVEGGDRLRGWLFQPEVDAVFVFRAAEDVTIRSVCAIAAACRAEPSRRGVAC